MRKKPKIRFSIPFNGDAGLMEEAFSTGLVYEVYFNAPAGYDFSSICPQNQERNSAQIKELIRLSGKYKVRRNILLNSPALSLIESDKAVKLIHSLEGKLDALTIADPFQVRLFRKEFPGLDIEASVIMDLNTPMKVERMIKAGINTANLPLDLNRDAQTLRRIASLKERYPGFKTKLMVNHICFYGCPYMQFHYFLSEAKAVFKPRAGMGWDQDKCALSGYGLDELIRRPFIRPEDVHFYAQNGFADIFKICFRTDETSVLRKEIFAYLKGGYDSNLLDIITNHGKPLKLYWDNSLFPAGFVEKVTSCDKSRCSECRYCALISRKVFRSSPKHADQRA